MLVFRLWVLWFTFLVITMCNRTVYKEFGQKIWFKKVLQYILEYLKDILSIFREEQPLNGPFSCFGTSRILVGCVVKFKLSLPALWIAMVLTDLTKCYLASWYLQNWTYVISNHGTHRIEYRSSQTMILPDLNICDLRPWYLQNWI